MSLLDCVGDIGTILASAFISLGLAVGVLFLPILPIFWLFTKVVESNLDMKWKALLTIGLFSLAFAWVVIGGTILECIGY